MMAGLNGRLDWQHATWKGRKVHIVVGVIEGGAVAYHAVCGAADPGLIYTGKVAVGDLCARCTKRATAAADRLRWLTRGQS